MSMGVMSPASTSRLARGEYAKKANEASAPLLALANALDDFLDAALDLPLLRRCALGQEPASPRVGARTFS